MGQISCFQGNELTEFNVLLLGPSGSGKTRIVTEKTLGPTISNEKFNFIELQKHLIKLNDNHGLNFYDTPGILSLFKQCLNQDIIQSVDIIACFPNSEQYKDYIKELLQNNTKLFKQIPFYDIPGDLDSKEIRNKIYLFILSQSKRKSKKPSYNQEIV
ncbi:unnamed protein product (macronuclear) [Paramecium tetraurelia]|uniref:Uncharacterized protein n=1 Tax=Paramecium tetraurelia TaxID=5888 RepID=A0DW94_PARTE|nr:uncharacterized protein GSPATT00020952001 [Paramecium tetraurelia]CAK87311.1 unnamed protein product [Paramecium tetraurelia]|eukprot:XP_001454708.1 hypothetical protein (macronuclear) [Paramecium tetraurelia strain d4-2]